METMAIYNSIHLCPLCIFYTTIPCDSNSMIINDSNPDTYCFGCFFKKQAVKSKVPECKNFQLREGFSKLQCPQCRNNLYFFIQEPYLEYPYEEKPFIIFKIVRCPSCQAKLQIVVIRKILPSTLEDWKKTGEMKKKTVLKGLEITPGPRLQTQYLIGRNDPFLNEERLLEIKKV